MTPHAGTLWLSESVDYAKECVRDSCARWFDPQILFISLFIFQKKVARKRINLKFEAVRSSDVKLDGNVSVP